jgi:hypothetical protein
LVYFNREKYLAYHRKYYYEHRKERKPHDLECRKNYKRKVKLQILEHYGSKCNCCGEININFLTIHHINGRHDKTKKEDKHSGFVLWNWLRLNNYPKGFQLLCYNCNCSMKHHMKQYCPVHHPELYLFSKAQNTHYFRFQQIGFQRRRQEVIKHYGNKCNCCGESHLEFLTIDHIQHSNKGLYGERLYRYLIRNNFPNGYQVLCWNCNSLKANLDNELCYVHHPEVYGSKPSRII